MRLLSLLLIVFPLYIHATLIQCEGKGSLHQHEEHLLLHLKGTAYERGYQHGVLLKEYITRNIAQFVLGAALNSHPNVIAFKEKIPSILPHIPLTILEELQGLAEGSGHSFEHLLILNLFPEMFHCSGLVVQGEATVSHELYHIRALDYRMGKDVQHTAVTMLIEPSQGYAYMSVSYAGFIGCITGINNQKISLGEVGGFGYGNWDGVPMAFLMKEVLEHSSSLEEAKQIFSSLPRTCEYYYLVSDGKSQEAVGIYATASQIQFIESGSSYALLAPSLPDNYQSLHNKCFLPACTSVNSEYQTALYDQANTLIALIHKQPKHTIIITGFAHPWRYPNIIQYLKKDWGYIDHFSLQSLLNDQTTLSSNLHNVIFLPSELKMWVAHAGKNGELAHTQNYVCFDLTALLEKLSFD